MKNFNWTLIPPSIKDEIEAEFLRFDQMINDMKEDLTYTVSPLARAQQEELLAQAEHEIEILMQLQKT